ncbi:MAG: 50S ribosomal protein L25 [Myxococcales bacterium]|nr:50S ribosomal protein L25 [Myxococcales bacterium]USN51868.1 MAG: 50S ribosomal protein L25 [Myxococcales bacterium]
MYNLKATKRVLLGKGPSRRLRMNQELPAVIYAKGQETLSITVDPRETTKALSGPLRRNVVINLEIADDSKKNRVVMVKERQIHLLRRDLIHVDFVEVDLKKPVVVSVPIKLSGKSESVVLGGKLDHVLQRMKIMALPDAIPEFIDVDITKLSFGSTHCQDIKLPEGISLAEQPRVVILTIKKPRGAAKEEEGAATPAKK